jgi:hypothetical protein
MPAPPRTRKASKALSRYKQKATLAQQILALRRVILCGSSYRTACEYVNAQSGALGKDHVITKTTLSRLYHSLPDALRSPLHASEGALLNFLQEQQSAQRANLSRSQSLLTQLEEELFAQWLVEMGKINLPLDVPRVIEEARRIVELQRGIAPSSSMIKWYRGFKRRHPGLTERICQDISKQRITAQQNEANIANYFHLLSAFRELPRSQIYAGDETGLDGDGARRPRVVTQCGIARVTQELDSYREHTSLMHIGNAAGKTLPLIFIFKGQQIDQAVIPLLPSDALVGCQESGYFTGQNFLRILQHLNQHSDQEHRPLLFIVDGAKSHIDLAAIDLARSKQINILCLPSQTTHLLQVADVALFGPFKQYWKTACEELKRERARSVSVEKRGIQRADIVPLVLHAWSLAMTPENVQSGFRRTGIYPYDPTAYKQTKEQRLKSLGGLPLLVSPIRELAIQPAVATTIDLLPVRVLTPAKPNQCGECGSKLKKRAVRRTLSTAAGVLLTGEEARQQVKENEERKRAEEDEKQRKRDARAAKRREKEVVGKGGKDKQAGRKRKAAEASLEEDKENVHPNVVARPLVFDPRMFSAGITVVTVL